MKANNEQPKTLWVRFSWPIEPKIRREIEELLERHDYIVHGWETDLIQKTADISLHHPGTSQGTKADHREENPDSPSPGWGRDFWKGCWK